MHGSAWSDTWRTELHRPAGRIRGWTGIRPERRGRRRATTRTPCKELDVTYASGDTDGNDRDEDPGRGRLLRCPSSTARTRNGKYVATVTNFVAPARDRRRRARSWFVMLGVLLMLALGTAWYLRANRMEPAAAGGAGAGTALPVGRKARSAHPITRLPAVARRRGNQCRPTRTGPDRDRLPVLEKGTVMKSLSQEVLAAGVLGEPPPMLGIAGLGSRHRQRCRIMPTAASR